MKYLVLGALALSVCACASASKPGAMVAAVTEETIIAEDSALREAVSVGAVTGGKETNPLWTSEVSNEDFAEALRQSLTAHAMLSTENGVYRIDAVMKELKQPFAGFNMKVTSVVEYTVTNVATGEVVLTETVTEPYTAKAGDAFLGVERLRLANEGSVRGNITTLIKTLIDKLGAAETAPTAVEEPVS